MKHAELFITSQEVKFEYDALGRRISKEYEGKKTKYLWDRNVIVHEWIEDYNIEEAPSEAYESPTQAETPSNSPKPNTPPFICQKDVISWLYKEGTFTPIAKLTEKGSYIIVTDHIGTPKELINEEGKIVWKLALDIYGKALLLEGGETEEESCNIRFPGQYEDKETGLYYNRFRYYMPEEGIYTQRDPIGLAGGNPTVYGYVYNPLLQIDPFGLNVKMGKAGELIAIAYLEKEGFKDIIQLQNKSGHGIDIVARDPVTNRLTVFEVKTTATEKLGNLKGPQKDFDNWLEGVLKKVKDETNGHWNKMPESYKKLAKEIETANKNKVLDKKIIQAKVTKGDHKFISMSISDIKCKK